MRAIEKYLSKFPNTLIEYPPNSDLDLVVTIPAFNESETLICLESLLKCTVIGGSVEILVNINFSKDASLASKIFNEHAFRILSNFAKQNSNEKLGIHVLYFPDQDPKVAGVGWARKQLMDEAFRRLISIGNEDGVITGFDADSQCQANYFVALNEFFAKNRKATACSIKFAHDIEGEKYNSEIYKAITLYELHLRYFINAQKRIGTPYAFQTVGSSFAVRAKHYAQVNGMAPKKAGEDFYFLQKVMALGHFYQLNTTCIFPSSRISNRVGFGTGPSVGDISKTGEKLTFNFDSFLEIEKMFQFLETIYKEDVKVEIWPLHLEFIKYLKSQKAQEVIHNLKRNHKSFPNFQIAFMQWFGGFQILKILNILSKTERFQDLPVIEAVNQLGLFREHNNPKRLLEQFRNLDGKESFYTISNHK